MGVLSLSPRRRQGRRAGTSDLVCSLQRLGGWVTSCEPWYLLPSGASLTVCTHTDPSCPAPHTPGVVWPVSYLLARASVSPSPQKLTWHLVQRRDPVTAKLMIGEGHQLMGVPPGGVGGEFPISHGARAKAGDPSQSSDSP